MDRETTTFKSPAGNEYVLKAYITAREARTIKQSLLGQLGGAEETASAKYNALMESQNATLKTVIISVDGKKDGVDGFSLIDFLLDLRETDFKSVLAKVDEIVADNTEKKTT